MTEHKWYSPSSIFFTKPQCRWLIGHLNLLRLGHWPPEHKETGYYGKGKGKVGCSAPFERPAQLAAELDLRIENCGPDGILLEFIYSSDSEDRLWLTYHIANALRLEPRTVKRRVKQALRFVAGQKRKRCSYQEWKQRGE